MNWYKFAVKPKETPLVGTLRSNDGYIYLDVDNRIVSPFLGMIPSESVVSPRDVTEKSKDVGAHISVIKKEETTDLKIKEIGDQFEFFVDGFHCVKPDGWDGVERVYFLTVKSPDLEILRKKYKLTNKIDGHEFHITVGVERSEETRASGSNRFILASGYGYWISPSGKAISVGLYDHDVYGKKILNLPDHSYSDFVEDEMYRNGYVRVSDYCRVISGKDINSVQIKTILPLVPFGKIWVDFPFFTGEIECDDLGKVLTNKSAPKNRVFARGNFQQRLGYKIVGYDGTRY